MSDRWVFVRLESGVRMRLREENARELGLWPPAPDEFINRRAQGLKMLEPVDNKMLPRVENKGGK